MFLLLLVIRGLTLVISLQSTFQSEKMMEVQGKINEINNKYAGVKDPNAKRMQQQEMIALYKKHNIKPFAAFQQMFLTMPIFLIIYRVVTILRPMKSISLFNI
ncbi:YidC/Oxa1 family membrane protein insertase [bacterium]|nr:YidC/Oxa1 family membrane protein insertase [bacterium]